MIHVVVLTLLVLFSDGSVKTISAVAPDMETCVAAGGNLRDSMLKARDVDQVLIACLPADIKPEPKA